MAIDLSELDKGRRTVRSDNLIDRIAQRLGADAGAQTIFGAPVERGGVTIVPVAKVRYGFGGGMGSASGGATAEAGSGSGGGGGVVASPLGYIELRDGQASFRRIKDPGALIGLAPVILAAGIAIGMILGGVRKLVRD